MDRENIKLLTAQLYGLLEEGASDEEFEKKTEELVHELKHCSVCNRPLVILHHCDFYPGDVCGHCQR